MDHGRITEIATLGGWTFGSDVVITGADPALATPWPVGEVAAVALALAGDGVARLSRRGGGALGAIRADVADAAAATISFALMRVDGASMARTNADNPWVDRYRAADGRWIHLHGGFPALADRLASLLDLPVDADAATIAARVVAWDAAALEDAVAESRGCSAIIRTQDEWRRHPHGALVHAWPTVLRRDADVPFRSQWAPSSARPLDGLRVLDLTRVLAGPTCGRTLAAFGADVLHVRGPNIPHVPAFVVDTGHGKRQAHAEFTDPDDLATLRRVALDADVVVQGYRPGVVGRFGLDEESLRADGFGGVYASVSAFGHEGPWSDRAGWEQLAQSTSGLCLDSLGDVEPAMLPCAFTDYTTGFVMAAGILEALDASLADGVAKRVDGSLCQTAAWILRVGQLDEAGPPTGTAPTLRRSETGFGIVEHLGPCVDVDGLDVGWNRPTTPLGDGVLGW